MQAAAIFERIMLRLFCGPECWEVDYLLFDSAGGCTTGSTRTHYPLSKEQDVTNLKVYGQKIAQDIGTTARMMCGISARRVVIHRVTRIW